MHSYNDYIHSVYVKKRYTLTFVQDMRVRSNLYELLTCTEIIHLRAATKPVWTLVDFYAGMLLFTSAR